ncbi:MAG: murein L,D-transpeptidase catalytic domain family protein [Lysobacteraceae bacterium]|nr:MAG: murein L,D-transpeptidase catalytic domain family protein [Xanthomonadaceae bacterium]
MSLRRFRLLSCLLLPLLACSAQAEQRAVPETLVDALARSAPRLDRKVLSLATRALGCSLRRPGGSASGGTLSVIDYSRPSTEPRLWVFDLARSRLLFEEWVAHGRNTGENLATRFSNTEGSYMSSLGGFETEEAYVGQNGYSLRLRGLEQGFNDQARDRAIVIHGAPYVSNELIRSQGRLGRSLGCPAVRPAVARQLIDTIRGGSFVFAYYPDRDWLQHSQLLDAGCGKGASAALAGGQR